jgi:precorrin-6x reductase
VSGVLNLVSVGPGSRELAAPLAQSTLATCDVIVAYELYLRWIQPWLQGKQILTAPLTQERERARLAIDQARAGRRVALLSSGDIGVYAMAALAFEQMCEDDSFDVQVVPGITAANACASLLGSPLSHDFATLSLSDLLCPWQWIEDRARHIAAADLACVFYNVQSATRQEGVYRILRVLLEHKSPQTICGVVRNAYREDQQVTVTSLGDLLSMRFDMLTTLVIGNRFTRRKRRWMFTPRGYNDWAEPVTRSASPRPPDNAIWVFSGTSDGNELAGDLARDKRPVVISAATEYGGTLAREHCPGAHVWSGSKGIETRRQTLQSTAARAIVDATHPYAERMSEQLLDLSRSLDIPYLRYERPSLFEDSVGELCESTAVAAARAIELGQRIFLATGSKDLDIFLRAPGAGERQWFARLAPDPAFLQRALDHGVPRDHLCAVQGPVSKSFNEALWRDWRIDCVVTKDSGEAGGFRAKAEAAAALGIPLLVIRRPQLDFPVSVSTLSEVRRQLQAWGIST